MRHTSCSPRAPSLWMVGCACAALLAAALGCSKSSSSPTTPTTPAAPNYDGTWRGTTSQSLPITFTVSGNTVTSMSVDITASMGGSSCRYTTGSQDRPVIANSKFSMSIGGGTVSTTLTGTFTSAAAVTGDIAAFSISGLACGSTLVFGTAVSQSAKTWQGTKG